MKVWTVYIIQTSTGRLYTGITTDLERRFKAHQKQKGARFFHFADPEKIVYSEIQPNRSEASKREAVIKKLKRKDKLLLIESSLITSP